MKTSLPAFGALILVVLLLASFIIDGLNVEQGGSIDYRNRVTGARLLAAGLNPYTYKWNRDDPEIYCDLYNNPKLPVSKTTVTPTMLTLTMGEAALPYRIDQWFWFLGQWTLLLGTAWLWWRRCDSFGQRALLGVMVTGLTYTDAWRLHVERGQSYVLLLFLFAFWLTGMLRSTRPRFLTGFALGLLTTLRPPFLLLLPFVAWRQRGQIAGAATGLLLGLVVPLFFSRAIWSDYFSAMQVHSELYRHAIDPLPGEHPYPPIIEGIPTDTLANYVAIPYADFSAHALLRGLGLEPVPALPVLVPGLVLLGGWAWLARRQPENRFLLGLAVGMFLIDLLLPAYRDSYNDVLALNILALGLVTAPRFSSGIALALLALLAGVVIYVVAPTPAWVIDIPSFLFTLSALAFLVLPRLGPKLDRAAGSVQNEAC
jgi:hypothetical protein